MIRGLAVSFLLLLFAVAVSAQTGHMIRGKVRSSSGAGMANVLVALESGNGALIGQTTTNSEGDFYYSGLTDNSYTVTISAPDHQPASQHVSFIRILAPGDTGETQVVDITLRPTLKDRQPSALNVFAQDIPPPARKKYDEATKLLSEKDEKKAVQAMRDALTIFPDYFDARLALATELMRSDQLNEAIVELEKARRIYAKDARLYQVFGMILLQKHMPDQAVEVLDEAVRLSPKDPQILYLRAQALIDSVAVINATGPDAAAKKTRLLNDAEKALDSAYELSGKKMAQVHLQMARVHEKRDRPKLAADELEKYLAASPNDKNAAAIRSAIKKLRDGS